MGKLQQKLSRALKSEKTKKIEERVKYCLGKAEKLYETNYDRGMRYLNVALNTYERLSKIDEELQGIIDSVGYAYANRGEPIK